MEVNNKKRKIEEEEEEEEDDDIRPSTWKRYESQGEKFPKKCFKKLLLRKNESFSVVFEAGEDEPTNRVYYILDDKINERTREKMFALSKEFDEQLYDELTQYFRSEQEDAFVFFMNDHHGKVVSGIIISRVYCWSNYE